MSDQQEFLFEGKMKWYSTEKGYGFVETENDGDVFLHVEVFKRAKLFEIPSQGAPMKVMARRLGTKLRGTKIVSVG